jgi:heterodisulfide reductase subunit C
MASADSAAEHHVARAAGWRTFRVINAGDDVDAGARPGEIECLAESRGKSCVDCGLCHGSGPKAARASIYIAAHGAKASRVGLAILQ